MSIIIHGMDMPTARDTLVLVKTDGTAIVYEDEAYVTTAASVPPHGRLGDLDELFKRMFVGPDGQRYPDKDVDGWDHAYTFRGIKHEILSAPTIIPAEEEKENE